MKRLFILTCLALGFTLFAFGQESNQVQDPPKYGFYYYWDTNSKSLVLLEEQTPTDKRKDKALGFGGHDVVREVKGAKSTVRFRAGQELVFYVRLLPNFNFAELEGAALLLKAEIKGNKRILSTASFGLKGRDGSPFEPASNAIKFKADKYSSETFKVTPTEVLDPGEYCFNGLGTPRHFCFGVDPAAQQ